MKWKALAAVAVVLCLCGLYRALLLSGPMEAAEEAEREAAIVKALN